MICIPIIAEDSKEARRKIERCATLAWGVEFRLDLSLNMDLVELLKMVRKIAPNLKVIITWRKKGNWTMAEEEKRIETFFRAVDLGADYIDLELEMPESRRDKAIAKCRAGQTKVIISHHDFEKTPTLISLERLERRMWATGADIVKIVTMARTLADNLTILRFLSRPRPVGREIVAFCMGEKGRLSRVVAPSFGAFFTFAALEKGEESAPGQVTVQEMKEAQFLLGLGGENKW